MPWKIVQDKGSGKFCVHKENKDKSAGELLKCYDSKEEATSYLRALYANVKESIIPEFSMYITKASLKDGEMRWSAVNSDTDWDLYGEKMTTQLYNKMLGYIQDEVPPPPAFKSMVCSDFWCGGMPYLSIAHYPDLNGAAVPGEPLELFVDGKQLKAKGILFDNALGKAVWKSLKSDLENQNKDKIRISIAFLDLAHKHGEDGTIFERKSLHDICPNCVRGDGNKIYVDGYLVHLALTTVPVNPRTIMQAEDIMARKSQPQTRKEDALSILGEENAQLVEQIDKSALEQKSDVLVEMSDTVSTDEVVVEDAKHDPNTMTASDMHSADCEDDATEGEVVPTTKKTKKSLTDEDLEVIRSLIGEALAPVVEDAKTKKDVSGDEGGTTEANPEEDKKVQKKSTLDLGMENLYNSVNNAIEMQGVTLEQRLESINPSLQELGNTITALVKDSMGITPTSPISQDNAIILDAVKSLSETVEKLTTEVAMIKSQTNTPSPNRIPVPRSIQAQQVVTQSLTEQPTVKPGSIADIARRSVGLK